MPKLNISPEEASKKYTETLQQMDALVLKFKGRVITDLTKQEAEEIWNLRGLLWEVAHYVNVSTKTRNLPARNKTDQAGNPGSRPSTNSS